MRFGLDDLRFNPVCTTLFLSFFNFLIFSMILRHAFQPLDNQRLAVACGSMDAHLRALEAAFGIHMTRRNETFRLEGDAQAVTHALELLQWMYEHSLKHALTEEELQLKILECQPAVHAPASAASPHGASVAATPAASPNEPLLRTRRHGLAGRTPTQHQYIQYVLSHDITFGIGPAGTGKTFLAVACAVDALERNSVQRLVLTRPAVEAGERLGFLPGDLAQKVDPYLRPLYDALYDLMGVDKVSRAFERGLIEVAPLAFMRGRTLNNAFVILDEAQNTTNEQMKMFLTRIGFGSKCVVTGDVSQIDLPREQRSGLIEAERILKNVNGIAFSRFTAADVVRHPLVGRIVQAYEAEQGATG
jgi:phosphate starvation-inducible protein PhoH and related proteins